jgi:hypothetical protein
MTIKKRRNSEISFLNEMDVLSEGLEASPGFWRSFMESIGKNVLFDEKKPIFWLHVILSFGDSMNIGTAHYQKHISIIQNMCANAQRKTPVVQPR